MITIKIKIIKKEIIKTNEKIKLKVSIIIHWGGGRKRGGDENGEWEARREERRRGERRKERRVEKREERRGEWREGRK